MDLELPYLQNLSFLDTYSYIKKNMHVCMKFPNISFVLLLNRPGPPGHSRFHGSEVDINYVMGGRATDDEPLLDGMEFWRDLEAFQEALQTRSGWILYLRLVGRLVHIDHIGISDHRPWHAPKGLTHLDPFRLVWHLAGKLKSLPNHRGEKFMDRGRLVTPQKWMV